MTADLSYDSSVFIDRSIESVFKTIGEAILLVLAIIFFFLRNFRATLIPLVTIPVSLVGAFGIMFALGFTINTLTLLALVLAIGLVVDDAIVVLENIYRHIEEGMPRRQAALQGEGDRLCRGGHDADAGRGLRPGGLHDRSHRQAVHRICADAGRGRAGVGFVALTLSPMMCSILLKHDDTHGKAFMLIEGFSTGSIPAIKRC
jgi:multidrug efflux pump